MILLVLFSSLFIASLGQGTANLGISKSGPDSFVIGYTLPYTYQINIANAGPDQATNLVMTDPVPSQFLVDTYSGSYSNGTVICDGLTGNTVTCRLPYLNAGDVARIFVNVTIPSNQTPFDSNNTACVKADQDDPRPQNNCNSKVAPVLISADIQLEIAGPSNAIAGQDDVLVNNVTITNLGFSDASDVNSCFNVTSPLVFVRSEVTGGTCGGFNPISRQVCCNFGTIPSQGQREYSIVLRVPEDANRGFVSFGACAYSNVTDPDLSNNCKTQTLNVTTFSDISVTKGSLPVVFAGQGETQLYTIVVENAGPSTALKVVLNDILPAPFQLLNASIVCNKSPAASVDKRAKLNKVQRLERAVQRVGPSCSNNIIGCSTNANIANRLNCTADVLGVLDRLLILVWVNVPSVAPPNNLPWITNNTAFVSSQSPDGDTERNQDSAIVEILLDSDVGVVKQGPVGVVVADDTKTHLFTFTVNNYGPSTAYGVTLNDAVPSPLVVNGAPTVVSGIATCNNNVQQSVSCDLGNMKIGDQVVITVPFIVPNTVVSPERVTNTVQVTVVHNDTYLQNNTDSAFVDVIPAPDVKIEKFAPSEIALDSQAIYYYRLVVTNLGPTNVASAIVFDRVPSVFEVQSGTNTTKGSCTTSGNNVTCDLGSFNFGEAPVTIFIPFKVKAGTTAGTYPNTANVFINVPDRDPENNNSTANTVLKRVSDIRVRKFGPEACVGAGSTVFSSFSIEVTNLGPSDAVAVTMTDVLNDAFLADKENIVIPANTTCSFTGQTLNCNLGNMFSGSVLTFVIPFRVPSSETQGSIANTASAYPADRSQDPNLANNEFSINIQVCQRATFTINKTGPDTVCAGGPVFSFTVNIHNEGPSTGSAVTIVDDVPAQMTPNATIPVSVTQGTCAFAGQKLSCNLGDIAPQGNVTVIYALSVAANVPDQIVVNTVTLNTTSQSTSSNFASKQTAICNEAPLTIKKQGPIEVNVGTSTTYNYTIVVTNSGISDARNTKIRDPIPAAFLATSVSPAQCALSGTFGDQTVNCDFGTLPPLAERTVTIGFTVPTGTSVIQAQNCAFASSTTQPANEVSDCVTTTILINADLKISKTGPASVCAGGSNSFKVSVFNTGPSNAKNVSVSDVLNNVFVPNGVPLVEGNTTGVSCGFAGQELKCTVAEMAAGHTFTVTYSFNVTASAIPGVVRNTATVSSMTPDDHSESDTSFHDTTIANCADLGVEKIGTSEIEAGKSGEWSFTVTNNGPSNAVNAFTVDTYPLEFTVPDIGSIIVEGSGTCSYEERNGRQVLFCTWPVIAPGEKFKVTFPFTVGSTVTPRQYENCVAVVIEPDTDLVQSNDFSCHSTTVTRAFNFVITKTGPSECIIPGADVIYFYTVNVHNTGPSDVEESILQDPLPIGFVGVEVSLPAGCTYDVALRTYRCTVPRMTPSNETQHSYVFQFSAAPEHGSRTNATNTATISSQDVSASASVTNQICPAADLTIHKNAPGSVIAGDGNTHSYVLFVQNNGPSTVNNVVVNDNDIPYNVFVVSSVTSEKGSCLFPVESDGKYHISCSYSNALNPRDTDSITISFTVRSNATGTITNCASISSSIDPNTENNVSCNSTVIVHNADLVTQKTGPSVVVAGGENSNTKYVITVTNAGVSEAVDAKLVDEVVPFPIASVSTSVGSCNSTAPKIDCYFGTLAPGASAVVEITFSVPETQPISRVCNEACASTTSTEAIYTNNCGEACTDVICNATLSITKTSNATNIIAGSGAIYTVYVTVKNTGSSASHSTNIVDTWPVGILSYVGEPVPSVGVCGVGSTGFSCNLGDLAPGESATITQSFQVLPNVDATTATNVARATNACGVSESAEEVYTIGHGADLNLIKDDCQSEVCVGGDYIYTISVKNMGPSEASNVHIYDEFWPVEYIQGNVHTIPPATSCAFGVSGAIDCTWDKVPSGFTVQLTIAYKVKNDVTIRNITNCASVNSTTPDPNPENNEDCDTNGICALADLDIKKTIDNNDCFSAGSSTVRTYSVTVTNLGPGVAQDVQVVENIPTQLQVISSPPGCITSNQHDYTCLLDDMNPGDVVVLRFEFIVPQDASAVLIENKVTVYSKTPDPELCNNNATLCSRICSSSDLSVTKTDHVTVVTAGENTTFVYTISGTNHGPSAAFNVQFVDIFPSQWKLVYVNATGATVNYTADGGFIVTVPVINVGETYTFTVGYKVPACLEACEVCNGVRITSDNPDTDESNNFAKDCNRVRTEADLEVCKSDGVTTVTAGDGILYIYTIQVGNNGPSCADCVKLVDHFPEQVTQVPGINITHGVCINTNGQDFSCSLDTMKPGDVITITVAYFVPANASTCSIVNTAIASSVTFDPQLCNNDAQDVNALVEKAELTITKTDNINSLDYKDTSVHVYTISVGNLGPSIARDLVLTDMWPDAFTQFLESIHTSQGACIGTGNDFTCPLGDLAKGAVATVKVSYSLCQPAKCGEVINYASVFSPTDSHCRETFDSTNVTGCPASPIDPSQVCPNCVRNHTLSANGYCRQLFTETCENNANCKFCIDSIIQNPASPPAVCFNDVTSCNVFSCLYNNPGACGGFPGQGGPCASPEQVNVTCPNVKKRSIPTIKSHIELEDRSKKTTQVLPKGKLFSPKTVALHVESKESNLYKVTIKNTLKKPFIISGMSTQVTTKNGAVESGDLSSKSAVLERTSCDKLIGRTLEPNWEISCLVKYKSSDITTRKVSVRGTAPVKGGYHPVMATSVF